MSFGENLQAIRRNNRMSQEDLADLLGVSRQAVSKWELGEGYPEVDKLLILSQKLNISLDSLMGNTVPVPETQNTETKNTETDGKIRIVSPHEGVIIRTAKVVRSQEYKGGKNSPKYALFATDGNQSSYFGPVNTFIGWYRNNEDCMKEIEAIHRAMDAHEASYTLQYSVKTKHNMMRTIEE